MQKLKKKKLLEDVEIKIITMMKVNNKDDDDDTTFVFVVLQTVHVSCVDLTDSEKQIFGFKQS